MADRNGSAFRRVLVSAERRRDLAIVFGLEDAKIRGVKSSASLFLVTFADHFVIAIVSSFRGPDSK